MKVGGRVTVVVVAWFSLVPVHIIAIKRTDRQMVLYVIPPVFIERIHRKFVQKLWESLQSTAMK